MTEETDWQVGDTVFAPWEPQWLYPGTILCIDDDIAFIRFDDGDRALIPLTYLRSVAIRRGNPVFCRREREEKRYYPATVQGVTDEGIRVRYVEDNEEDLVPISHCRILASPQEEG
jgi:hypothetical protein